MKSFIHLFACGLLSAALASLPVYAAKAKSEKQAEPSYSLTIDHSPLPRSKNALSSYADSLDQARKAIVSVYSSKIISRRAVIPPQLRPFYGFGELPEEQSREEGLGSGVVVTSDGYILTNHHVVADADELEVALPDKRRFPAKLIASDPKTDVAIIKIDANDLPVATLADSDQVRVGDVVFALGNPLGLGQTVTMGIISATGRNDLGILQEVDGYENFLQTDASINQGNSGGALVDALGRLIGINTAIISPSRGNIGIGFAIPANLAVSVMESLIKTGTVTRGFLGITGETLTPEIARAMNLDESTQGAIVVDVSTDSPAEKAGLRRNDIITAVNKRQVSSIQDLRIHIAQMAPDTKVTLHYIRDEKDMEVDVVLGALDDAFASSNPLKGITIEPLDAQLRNELRIDSRIEGLLISSVSPDSPYVRRLAPGSVIVEVNQTPVSKLSDLSKALRPGHNLLLIYYRNALRLVPITIES